MKHTFVLWNRIKTHWKEHFVIVLLFLLGIFASTLFYIYYYGDYVKPEAYNSGLDYLASQYTLCFTDAIPASDDRLDSLEAYGEVTVYAKGYLEGTETSDFLSTGGVADFVVQGKKGNDFGYGASYGSVDLNQREDCIVFSTMDRFLRMKELKQAERPEILYGGTTLTVIGVHNWGSEACVPYALFENGTLDISQILIFVPKYLNRSDSAEFTASLQTMFPEAEVRDPYVQYGNYFRAEDTTNVLEWVKISGLMLLAVLTFTFLAKHLFDQSRSENNVYRVVGAKRGDVVFLALAEVLCFAAVAVGSAVLTHVLLYPSFFEKIRLNVNQPYTALDYLLTSGCALLICIVACIPFLVALWRKTVIQLKSDGE